MSNYPTSVDDASSLYSPVDVYSTKLGTTTTTASCLSSDASIQVADTTTGFPATYGIITIGDEKILYASKNSTHFLECSRGFGGSTAVGHSSGVAVKALFVTDYITALQLAIEALQTTLGVTGAFNFFPTSTELTLIDIILAGVIATPPRIAFIATDAATDNKLYQIYANATQLIFRIINDALTVDASWMIVTRSGATVANVQFPHGISLASGSVVSDIVTSIASPGSDSNIPTEKSVRSAITSAVTTPAVHASTHASSGSDPVTLAESQITNLTTDLAAKVPTSRTVNGHALSGNISVTRGDLSLDATDFPQFAGINAHMALNNIADRIYVTDGATDEKYWEVYPTGHALAFRTIDDTYVVGDNWMVVHRSGGVVTSVEFVHGIQLGSGGVVSSILTTVASPGSDSNLATEKAIRSAITSAVATPAVHASSHASGGSDPVTLAESQITNLVSDLAAKVPTSRTVNGHALTSNVNVTRGDLSLDTTDFPIFNGVSLYSILGHIVLVVNAYDAGTDEKNWDVVVDTHKMLFRTVNDAYNNAHNWMVVNRSGFVVSSVEFPFGIKLAAGGAVDTVVTAVGSTGSDSSLPTEKSVRTAIDAVKVPTGGSIGQVLTKNSGTSNDVVWATPTVGTVTSSFTTVTSNALAKFTGTNGRDLSEGPSVVTSVGSPGSNSNLATEAAVRTELNTKTDRVGSSTTNGIVTFSNGTGGQSNSGKTFVTSVSDPGSDSYIPTERAVNTAFNAIYALIATVQSDVATLNSEMSTATTDISNLQSDMSTANSGIAALDSGKADHGNYSVSGGGGGSVAI